MNFREYDELHERCELYKVKAIIAILDIKSLNIKDPYLKNCYMYQSGVDELTYVIDEDGFEHVGKLPIEVLDLYLDGKVDEARARLGR